MYRSKFKNYDRKILSNIFLRTLRKPPLKQPMKSLRTFQPTTAVRIAVPRRLSTKPSQTLITRISKIEFLAQIISPKSFMRSRKNIYIWHITAFYRKTNNLRSRFFEKMFFYNLERPPNSL